MSNVRVKVYAERPELLPKRATEHSAGFDIVAKRAFTVVVGKTTFVETGVFLEIPEGFVGKIHARSGMSTKNGVVLVNGVGVIDSDYRNEVKVALTLLANDSYPRAHREYVIETGDRVAQLLIERVEPCEFVTVDSREEFSVTKRNLGGFGSTGR